MILLSGHSLTVQKKVDVEALSLDLKERDSTAVFVPADMSDISVNSWFKDDTEPGAGIVWRVGSIQQIFDQRTAEIHLEHAINVLRDRIMFGEITPETMSGTSGATTCTARQAITYILNQQSDWTLYSFDYDSVSSAYKFNGDSLYDALEAVTRTLDGAWWSYDMSVYPFRLNITAKPSGVVSELRPGRNLRTISKTVDRGGMYTRFYPIGKDDLHITGNYVSKNESTYGTISHVEVDMTLTTEAELTAWANERLNKHADPTVTVMVSGLELADATGESLDRMRLGRLCRIPLTEFSTTIEERITALSYPDKVHQPEVVNVTLSNKQDDVTRNSIEEVLAEQIKEGSGPTGRGGGGGGRGGAVQQREDHAWFEDTDDHVAMVAEGIVGYDSNGKPNWGRLSQFIVDGEGVHGSVHTILDGVKTNQSTLDMTESRVSIVVTNDSNPKIKAAEITAAINNQTGQSIVRISADIIDVDGLVNKLKAKAVTTYSLDVLHDTTVYGILHAPEIVCGTNLTLYNETTDWHDQTVVTSIGQTKFTKTFRLSDGTTWEHAVVTDVSYNNTTIHYLGN